MILTVAKHNALRAEFERDTVGKRPRVACRDCYYANNGRCAVHALAIGLH